MFTIKYVMAEKTSLPTLILDEIDSGISGEIAIQLGRMMKEMATRHQLITITHLPQIASKGDVHYVVYKEDVGKTVRTGINKLNKQDRINEIARMLSGEKLTDAAIENAKELLSI